MPKPIVTLIQKLGTHPTSFLSALATRTCIVFYCLRLKSPASSQSHFMMSLFPLGLNPAVEYRIGTENAPPKL